MLIRETVSTTSLGDPRDVETYTHLLPSRIEPPKVARRSMPYPAIAEPASLDLPFIGQRGQQPEPPSNQAGIRGQSFMPPSTFSPSLSHDLVAPLPAPSMTPSQGTLSPAAVQDDSQNKTSFANPTNQSESRQPSIAPSVQDLTGEDRERYEQLREKLFKGKTLEMKGQQAQLEAKQDAWLQFKIVLPDL